MSPAVIAIIVLVAAKLARLTDGRDAWPWAICGVVAAITAGTGTEVAFLFVGAGTLILLWDAPPSWLPLRTAAGLLGFPSPLGLVPAAVGSGTLLALFLFFRQGGAFVFGSGLAIVPFLREGVVSEQHWLTERQFLDAVAVGLITPGPGVCSRQPVGRLGGCTRRLETTGSPEARS